MLFQERAVLHGVVRHDRRRSRCHRSICACSVARDFEQFGVARREIVDQRRQALPEALGIDAGGGQRLGLEHVGQLGSHEQVGRATYPFLARRSGSSAVMARSSSASSAGFTSLQKTSIVRFASSSVMSPTGSCSTM